ncbi:MAG: hypothetical protein WD048_15785 [Chitinophagales bacterium]
MHHMKSLSSVMNELEGRGYEGNYRLENGKLLSSSGKEISRDQLQLEDTYRFEGSTNPDDMSILYKLKSENGDKIMLIDSFGPEADPSIAKFVQAIQESE